MHFFPRIIPFISISFKQHTGPSSCLQQYWIFKKYKTRWNILSEMVNRLRALVDMNNVLLLTFVNKPETFKWTFQLFMSNIQLCLFNEGWIISDVPRMLQSPQSINQSHLCSLTFSIKGDWGVETVLLWNRSMLWAGKSHFTACGCPVWSLCQHIPSWVCKAVCKGERCSMVNGALPEMSVPAGNGEMNNQWHSSMVTCERGIKTAKSRSII